MLNKTTFQGRFTAKPEVQDKGGFSLCEFTIAWSDKYKDREDKCFLRCKAWRGMADFVGKYFDKGQECVVEGKLITEQWEADGKKQSRTICNVDKVHFCGSKASNKAEEIPAGEEELPFS